MQTRERVISTEFGRAGNSLFFVGFKLRLKPVRVGLSADSRSFPPTRWDKGTLEAQPKGRR